MSLTDARTKLYQTDATKDREGHFYKGIREYAKTGLLAHLATLVAAELPKGSSVLDLASGAGALALRIKEAGFEVSASDYVVGNFRPDIPFTQADYNEPFAHLFGCFDCVVASEIIEHLENPRHLLRELKKILKPDGVLIITTPNPDSPVSKALYLAYGHFAWFSNADYQTLGHITPISPRLLKQIANECGYSITLDSWSSSWDHVRGWPRMRLYAIAASLLDRGALKGDILIAQLRPAQDGVEATTTR